MDYRDIPLSWENAFDTFVSVEMLEHVGSKYYADYFRLVSFALKPHGATAVVSASTFPESRYSSYQAEDFMRKYMWPNSSLPSASALIHAASPHFNLERVENHAAHYPRTLREWGRRLERNLTQDMVARDYPGLGDDCAYEAFKKKWMYLFAYAGAGFAKGYITCHMLTFIREVRLSATIQLDLVTDSFWYRTMRRSCAIETCERKRIWHTSETNLLHYPVRRRGTLGISLTYTVFLGQRALRQSTTSSD